MKTIPKTKVAYAIKHANAASSWRRGVKAYALNMLNVCKAERLPYDRDDLNALIMPATAAMLADDAAIARRICSPAELRRCDGGRLWLDRDVSWRMFENRAMRGAFSMIADHVEGMTHVSFDIRDRTLSRFYRLCCDRAGLDLDEKGRLTMEMDILAAHANGCPMDFAKLYASDSLTFTHDVVGIFRHIDRTTGELAGYFLPRCAIPESEIYA